MLQLRWYYWRRRSNDVGLRIVCTTCRWGRNSQETYPLRIDRGKNGLRGDRRNFVRVLDRYLRGQKGTWGMKARCLDSGASWGYSTESRRRHMGRRRWSKRYCIECRLISNLLRVWKIWHWQYWLCPKRPKDTRYIYGSQNGFWETQYITYKNGITRKSIFRISLASVVCEGQTTCNSSNSGWPSADGMSGT